MISYTADFIFDGYQFLSSNSSIEVNERGEIISINQANRCDKQHLRGLLMPGMVNAHCHIELSHLRGKIAKHTGLVEFLQRVMSERRMGLDEEMEACMLCAEEEMLRNGIVAVGDICNTGNTIEIKKRNRLHYHSFVELIGLNPDMASTIVEKGLILSEKFESVSLALHAPYSITPELLTLTDENNRGEILSLHHQESSEENKLFEHETSRFLPFLENITGRPYVYWHSKTRPPQATVNPIHQSEPIILVHNTYSSEQDIEYLRQQNKMIYLCACAGANLYIENTLPNIPMWLENNMPLVLGTDSLASNDELSIVNEIILLHRHYPKVDVTVWLYSATLQGARALNMQEKLGSLELGKSPGLIQIENWKELLTESQAKAIIKRWV